MTPIVQELIHTICYAPSSFITDLACAQMLRIEKRFRYAAVMTVLHAIVQMLAGTLRRADARATGWDWRSCAISPSGTTACWRPSETATGSQRTCSSCWIDTT